MERATPILPADDLSVAKSRTNRFIIVSILMLLSTAVVLPAQKQNPTRKQKLSEREAVRVAEEFVAQSGYTDLPPDKSKLAYESIEWESNVDEMLRRRHDTLERKAYGILRGRKDSAKGWTVVFRYRHPSSEQDRRTGRAVTMNLDGSGLRVEHVSFILKYVERKL